MALTCTTPEDVIRLGGFDHSLYKKMLLSAAAKVGEVEKEPRYH